MKRHFRPWVKITLVILTFILLLGIVVKVAKSNAYHCPICGAACTEVDGDGHTFEVCPEHGSVEPR